MGKLNEMISSDFHLPPAPRRLGGVYMCETSRGQYSFRCFLGVSGKGGGMEHGVLENHRTSSTPFDWPEPRAVTGSMTGLRQASVINW